MGNRSPRLTMAQKNASGKQWYKDSADRLDGLSGSANGGSAELKRMKVNYDLFNSKLNVDDFMYVCQPFGREAGELPAQMVNRDIVSGKIKALMGMEMRIPFNWKVVAVNPEATTRKEQHRMNLLRNYVVGKILEPPTVEELNRIFPNGIDGKPITPGMLESPAAGGQGGQGEQAQPDGGATRDGVQQMMRMMGGQGEGSQSAQTPEQVARYMEREYQDPAEVLASQLLEYLSRHLDLRVRFNNGFKHLCLSAKEIYYVGIVGGEPTVWNVNSMRFNADLSPDSYCVEDGEWATCEYWMSPSEVVRLFGREMTGAQIDTLYDGAARPTVGMDVWVSDGDGIRGSTGTIRVLHCVWKALRKVRFLTYSDASGEMQETIVDETYVLNAEGGDVSVQDEWLPEVYETWKIGADIYVYMQPVAGQFKDIDNVHRCKLPYYGVVCDNVNSEPVSIMDRLKFYQYFYNIVMYRIELLLASDKGKKILMNINAIPDSDGIDLAKWQYFMESTPFLWFNPNEEGTGYNDINNMAKQIDLSLASDISKYIELAEYLRRQAGQAIGISERLEGEVGNRETSANYSQALQQSSNILEPYFNLHSQVKRNVLTALLEQAKVAYSVFQPQKLTYVLDDLSQQILRVDPELLDGSTYGLFVSDSFRIEEMRQSIQQLAHAALQNQQVELVDVLAVLRQESSTEAEEILKVRQKRRMEEAQQLQQQQQQAAAAEEQKRRDFEKEKHRMDMELARLKEEERRKTELAKMSIMGASFNSSQDNDASGVNDYVELAGAYDGTAAQYAKEKAQGDRVEIAKERLAFDRKMQEQRLELEREKLELEREKLLSANQKLDR